MNLYCIYDRVAEESGPLFESKNDLMALRMYNGVNLPGNPEDFELLKLGVYHHCPVSIKPLNAPIKVVSGTSVIEDDPDDLGEEPEIFKTQRRSVKQNEAL